jgi:hypothetical protein
MELNPLLIIDDDEDDLDMIKEAAKCMSLSRPIHFFAVAMLWSNTLKRGTKHPFLLYQMLTYP